MKNLLKNKTILAATILTILLISTLLITNQQGITGLITQTTQTTQTTQNVSWYAENNTNITLQIENITSIKITGEYIGSGTAKIYLVNNETKYLIETITQEKANTLTGFVTGELTEKIELNISEENQNIEYNEQDARQQTTNIENQNYTNQTNTTQQTQENTTINETTNTTTNQENQTNTQEPNTQINNTINSNNTNTTTNQTNTTQQTQENTTINETTNTTTNQENQTNTQEPNNQSNESKTPNIEQNAKTKPFENSCLETCTIQKTTPTHIEILIENGTINITQITYTQTKDKEQIPIQLPTEPQITQTKTIQDITASINENITINASEYFTGTNNFYDLRSSQQYTYKINKDLITITPTKKGTTKTTIYANNQETTITSNEFTIKITDNKTTTKQNLEQTTKQFKPKEKIELDFNFNKQNAKIEKILKTKIKDSNNKEINLKTEITKTNNGQYNIKIPETPRNFKPGKYTVQIQIEIDNEIITQEQDFLWGVLAINTNKDTYKENEQAKISLGVLDDQGKMVCDAEINITITTPTNKTETITTKTGQIQQSPECEYYGITNQPDYYTTYNLTTQGNYTLNIIATTPNGPRTTTQTIKVTNTEQYQIERNTATRIYPLEKYTVNITIHPQTNYTGTIKEYVPTSFQITQSPEYTITQTNDTKTITWNKKIQENQPTTITYEYDAPDISPQFYLLGPIDIENWTENREWQIANDAPLTKTLIPTTATHSVDGDVTSAVEASGGTNSVIDGAPAEAPGETIKVSAWNETIPTNAANIDIIATIEISTASTDFEADFSFESSGDSAQYVCTTTNGATGTYTCNATAQGIDTAAEANSLNVTITGYEVLDSKGPDAGNVDYIKLDITYDVPEQTTTATQIYKDATHNEIIPFYDITGNTLSQTTYYSIQCNDTSGELSGADITGGIYNTTGYLIQDLSGNTTDSNGWYNSSYTLQTEDEPGNWIINVTCNKTPGDVAYIESNDNKKFHVYSGENISAYTLDWDNDAVEEKILENKHLIISFEDNNFIDYIYNKDETTTYNFGSITDTATIGRGEISAEGQTPTYTTFTFNQEGENINTETTIQTNISFGGNGDDELLIVGADRINSELAHFIIADYNETSGEFDILSNITLSSDSSTAEPNHIIVGDILGDQKNEIILAVANNSGTDVIQIYNSTFDLVASIETAGSQPPWMLGAGDILGNSKQEISQGGGPPYNGSLYANDGADNIYINFTVKINPSIGVDYGSAIGDVDNDDENELILTENGAVIYDWTGTAFVNNYNASPGIVITIDAVDIGNSDGDENTEILLCGATSEAYLFEWNGAGYTNIANLTPGDSSYIQDCAFGNFDGDGDDEIVLGGNGNEFLYVYDYSGGTYQNTWNSTGCRGGEMMIIDTGDIDGDGDDEISTSAVATTCTSEANTALVYDYVTMTNFVNIANVTMNSDARTTQFGDADSDGIGTGASFIVNVSMKTQDVDYLTYILNQINITSGNLTLYSALSGTIGGNSADDKYHLQNGTNGLISALTDDSWTNYTESSTNYSLIYDDGTTDTPQNSLLALVRFNETTNPTYEGISILDSTTGNESQKIKYYIDNTTTINDQITFLLTFTNGTNDTIDQWMTNISQNDYPTPNFYTSSGTGGETPVNNAPNTPVPTINTTDENNYTNQDLNCTATITDNDTEDKLNVTIKWYKNGAPDLEIDYNNSYDNGTVFNATLQSENTSIGENWSCGIILNDGTNSSIEGLSENLTIRNRIPTFSSITTDNSDATTPTNESSNVTFTATISDLDSDNIFLLVCNSSTTPSSGSCGGDTLCTSTTESTGSQVTCQFNTTGITTETQNWWSYACDSRNDCGAAETTNSPFNINHKPYASGVSITPSNPNTSNTLTCEYTFNDDDSGDTEQTSTFEWYLQNEGTGGWNTIESETSSTLSNTNFDSNDKLICGVKTTDNHQLPDNEYVNSTETTINQGAVITNASINDTTITTDETILLTANCTVNEGDTTNTNIKIQDNRTGTFSDSSTNTGDDIYTNTTSYNIGTLTSQTSNNYEFLIQANTEGTYTIRSVCTTDDGNPTIANSTNITLTINSVPVNATPTVNINATQNNTHTNNNTPAITFNYTDDDTTANCTLYFNDTAYDNNATTNNATETTLTANTTITDGNYTIYVNCTDGENTAQSNTINLVIDTIEPTINIESPIDNSGSTTNTNITFNVTDTYELTNCSLNWEGTPDQVNETPQKETRIEFRKTGINIGSYNWNITCTDQAGNTNSSQIRTLHVIDILDFNGTTTDITNIDITNIDNFILEKTGMGKILFLENTDLSNGLNISQYVTIGTNTIYVDSENAQALNNSANLTIYSYPYTQPIPMKNGETCTTCTTLNDDGENITFNVTSFSNYTTAENTTLQIWDNNEGNATLYDGDNTKYTNQEVMIYANYTNASSEEPITSATCNITINDSTSYIMSYNGTVNLYYQNKTFTTQANYSYNITCNKTEFANLNTTDTIEILDEPNTPPIMQTPTILPTTAYTNDTLLGYCNATDNNQDNVTYYWKWYLNGTETKSNSYYCYQETANESNSDDGNCNLNYTGTYQCTGGDWDDPPCTNTYDGNWTTYEYSGYNDSFIYINYTKPTDATTASLWQVKDSNGTQNISIGNWTECWNQETLQLKGQANDYQEQSDSWYCYNGTNWEEIRTTNTTQSGYIYEEAMFWAIETTYEQGIQVNIDNITSTQTNKNDEWILSCLANDGTTNSTWTNSTTTTIQNTPPNTITVNLNSTDGTNTTNQDLNCWTTITDDDTGDTLNVTTKWYKNSQLNLTITDNSDYTNGSTINYTLQSANTTINDEWTCGITLTDGTDNSNEVNSTTLTIQNTPPTTQTPTLISTGQTNYTNETIIGYCNATDADTNNITYYWKWYLNGTENKTGNETITTEAQTIFQEDANSTLSTGTWQTTWNFSRVIDGDDGTYGYNENGGYGYFNYTKPEGAISTIHWWVKDNVGTQNITLPENCVTPDPIQLRVYSHSNGPIETSWQCYNGTNWVVQRNATSAQFIFEENIQWNLSETTTTTYHEQGLQINIDNLTSSETTPDDEWIISCLASDGTDNGTWTNSTTLTIQSTPVNNPPNTPTPTLNTTDNENATWQNLNCSATITDDDSSTLNVTVKWYKDGELNLTITDNSNYANGTQVNYTLQSENLTEGDQWICGITTTDGENSSNEGNSTALTVRLPCGTLNEQGRTYMMTENLTKTDGDCYTISETGITLDCNGYTLTGNGDLPVYSAIKTYGNDTTIKNCIIQDFNTGIEIRDDVNYELLSNINVTNNTITGNVSTAIESYADYTGAFNNIYIENNNINTTGYSGIYAHTHIENSTITNNNINVTSDNAQGIRIHQDYVVYGNNTITNNNIFINGTDSEGIYLQAQETDSNVSNNTITTYGTDTTGIHIYSGSNNNKIHKNTITTEGIGIKITSGGTITLDNEITNNTINSTQTHIQIGKTTSPYNYTFNTTTYYNNLTGTGQWINNTEESNKFNTTVNGAPQGNYYPNTTSYAVYDSDEDGWGDTGLDYPFNQTTLGTNLWEGLGADYGPATTQTLNYIIKEGPADHLIIDRDNTSTEEENEQTLLIRLHDDQSGKTITFKANLTMPASLAATNANIILGTNTTNSTGHSTIIWNGTNSTGSKLMAGNYTWWAETTDYESNETGIIYVYGGLNLTWRYTDQDPNSTYIRTDTVILDEFMQSLGPETDEQVNTTYLATVNTTLQGPSGNETIELLDPDIYPEDTNTEQNAESEIQTIDNSKQNHEVNSNAEEQTNIQNLVTGAVVGQKSENNKRNTTNNTWEEESTIQKVIEYILKILGLDKKEAQEIQPLLEQKIKEQGKARIIIKETDLPKDSKLRNKIKQKTKDYIAIEITENEIEEIRTIQKEKAQNTIQLEKEFTILTTDVINITQTNIAKQNYNLTGNGTSICIIDTGYNPNTDPNTTNTVLGWNIIENNTNYNDTHGHGTIITWPITQIAPQTKLIIAKAVSDNGRAYSSDIISALEYCAQENATIISISLGSGEYEGRCDEDLVAQKINELTTNNSILTITSTGNNGFKGKVTSPACASTTLQAGSSTKTDELANFTNYNNDTHILAPGKEIQTKDNLGNTINVTGTSISAPIIAGITSLIMENNQTLTINETKELLIETGKVISITDSQTQELRNFSRIDTHNALIQNITNTYEYENTSFQNGTQEEFVIQAFSCDQGDLDTQCNITGSVTPSASEVISGTGNLLVKSGGSIKLAGGTFTINMTGNITIETGGEISTKGNDGADGGANSGSPGGNLVIDADNIIVNGNITSQGGDGGDGSYTAGGHGAAGGTLNIIATTLDANGKITTDGGTGGIGTPWGAGGNGAAGGTLNITTDEWINNSGNIISNGGNGAGVSSGTIAGGTGGNGGIIKITGKNLINTGTITSNAGNGGEAQPSGNGGTGNSLTITIEQNLTSTNTISVNGGNGGDATGGAGGHGAAGGTINTNATTINLTGTISATGGNGGIGTVGGTSGNGANGGTINIYYDQKFITTSNINTKSGNGGNNTGTMHAGDAGNAGNVNIKTNYKGNTTLNIESTANINTYGGLGGETAGSAYKAGAGGDGGNLILEGQNITITGTINTRGGDNLGCDGGWCPPDYPAGNAGNITITGINTNITGTITADGGNGHDTSTGNCGTGGNGANTAIKGYYLTLESSTIDSTKGLKGTGTGCVDGADGTNNFHRGDTYTAPSTATPTPTTTNSTLIIQTKTSNNNLLASIPLKINRTGTTTNEYDGTTDLSGTHVYNYSTSYNYDIILEDKIVGENITLYNYTTYYNISNDCDASASCTTNASDYNYCDASNSCVYKQTCYADGYSNSGIGGDLNAECTSGTWYGISSNEAPTINIDTTLNNTFTQDNTPSVTFNFTDPENETAECTIYFDGANKGTNTTTQNNTQTTIISTSNNDGNYTIYVNCTDGENTAQSDTINLIIDTTKPTINIESPINSAGSTTTATIQYNVSDTYNPENCSLNWEGSTDQVNETLQKETSATFTKTNLAIGSYEWNVTCTDQAGNTNSSEIRTLHIIDTTIFDGTTTNITNIDITNVNNFEIEKSGTGKITFLETVDLSNGLNISQHVTIGAGYIYIDSENAQALNKSANLTMQGLQYEQTPVIYKDDQICTTCESLSYNSGTLIFNVTSFSNYTTGNNSQLNITDSTDTTTKYTNQQITFTANYTNITSGESINGTEIYCNLTVNNTEINMTFNTTTTLYEYNRTFETADTYSYSIFCNGSLAGYEPLNVSTSLTINAPIKHWNATYNTTDKALGLYNLTSQGQADWFFVTTNSETKNFTLLTDNTIPDTPQTTINSTDGTNGTDQNINCYSTITDSDNDTMNVTVNWNKNGELNLTITDNLDYTNGTQVNYTLQSENTTQGEKWNCEIRTYDGENYSLWGTSENITINNINYEPSFYEPQNDENTILLAHYDDNYNGEDGETGTATGTNLETGKVRNGVKINETNTLTYTTANNINSDEGTIEFWIQPNWNSTDGQTHTLYHTENNPKNGFKITKTSTEFLQFAIRGNTGPWIIVETNIQNEWKQGNWYHVAGTWNITNGEIKLYINGIERAQTTNPLTFGTLATNMHIGSDNAGSNQADATIDLLRISNTTRTTFNIEALITPTDKQVIETNTTTLNWSTANDRNSDSITYRLIIDDSSDYSTPEVDISEITDTNYTLNTTQELGDGNYYWKIIPSDSLENGDRSNETWYFTIDAEPPQILNTTKTPITPHNNDSINFTAKIIGTLDSVWYEGNWTGTLTNYTAGIVNSEENYSVIINSENFSNQENIYFRWHANDSQAQESGQILEFQIENREPNSSIIETPTTGTTLNQNYMYINWTNTTDPDYGNGCEYTGCNVTFKLYASTDIGNVSIKEPSAIIYSGTELEYNWTSLTNNTYYLMIVTNDGIDENESSITNFTLTTNTAPQITYVESINAQDPQEGQNKTISITFTVNDAEGNNTINASSAQTTISLNGVSRTNNTCQSTENNATSLNITCSVQMTYYDEPGAWNINVSAKDTSESYVENTTTTLTYNELSSISLNLNEISFGTVNLGEENINGTTLIINNAGNSNFTNITIKAYDLANGTNTIGAGNISINTTNSATGQTMQNNTEITIINANLDKNTDSITRNETIYYYIDIPSTGLPAATYTAIEEWILTANT